MNIAFEEEVGADGVLRQAFRLGDRRDPKHLVVLFEPALPDPLPLLEEALAPTWGPWELITPPDVVLQTGARWLQYVREWPQGVVRLLQPAAAVAPLALADAPSLWPTADQALAPVRALLASLTRSIKALHEGRTAQAQAPVPMVRRFAEGRIQHLRALP